ncbi:hypothetical protein GTP45_19565 [Pseudoduganella sp. FT55W]|uniref:GP-PDE domain-containing protein n=1 Tax=Duganella rivi TaxID=2666083 RepID=A0A7X4GTU7_9BURK|nr:glycerophosphodiester phosphodiesterase family protein [Duganella rivi]MYM69019.1 hypothetical protein [Duganella rivi]
MLKKRVLSGVALFLLALVAAAPSQAQNPCRINTAKVMNQIRNPIWDLKLLVAHRGLHARWNDPRYNQYINTPENSLEAIWNAANACMEIIEVDIRQTQDGVPILSHDASWGRETNVGYNWGSALYNAMTGVGPNPLVNSWSLKSVKKSSTDNGLLLRTNAQPSTANGGNWEWSKWNENPPTLEEVINDMRNRQNPAVLAIDVKDRAALQNAWYVVAKTGFYNRAFFKVDVNMLPNAWEVDNFFGNLHYVTGNPNSPDSNYVKIMPVYNTANIQPNNALGAGGGEDKVRQSAYSFYAGNKPWYMGQEVNIKQDNGILQATQNDTVASYSSGSRAFFNPTREYESGGKALFYNSDGRCCSELTAYLFNGAPYGLQSDTADNRTDWNLFLHTQTFNMITTDNVLWLNDELKRLGVRNMSRITD